MSSEPLSTSRRLPLGVWLVRNILLTALLFAMVASKAQAQTLLIEAPTVDAGMVPRGIAITKEFSVKNSGSADLHILDVKPACGCMVAKFDKTIRPGAEGRITLTIDTKSFRSPISKTATVTSDDPANPQTTLIVVANVKGYVTALPSEFLRIRTTTGQTGAAEVILASDYPDFRPSAVTTTKSYLRASLTPDRPPKRWKLTLICDASAPIGMFSESVIVQTGIAQEPQMRLPVTVLVLRVGEAAQTADSETAKSSEAALTNQEIVKLVAAELGDEVVIAKIKNASVVQFDVTTDALLALKAQKISKTVVAAMIERAGAPPRAAAAHAPAAGIPQPPPGLTASSPCAGVELMGLFNIDKRPMAPLIIYLAKIRNGSSMTRIVTIEWLDMYGQEMTSTNEIAAGQIVTAQLGANSPRDRQPTDLRITSCR